MEHRIVVWDPLGRKAEGEVVRASRQQALDEFAGAATLPVEQRLLGMSPIAGYFRRAWGRGEPFAGAAARRACPMALHVVPDCGWIHWMARLVPFDRERRPTGQLRLAASPNAFSALSGGLSAIAEPVVLPDLGPPDAWGGWTVARSVGLAIVQEGLLVASLQGVADGVAVLWSACSQSTAPEPPR